MTGQWVVLPLAGQICKGVIMLFGPDSKEDQERLQSIREEFQELTPKYFSCAVLSGDREGFGVYFFNDALYSIKV